MKQFYIVSAVGRDRPGLVNKITSAIHRLGGNIELQRSTRMASEFAMLALFSTSGETTDLVDELNALAGDTLYISVKSAIPEAADREESHRSFNLTASGADQQGIIEAVTLVLFKERINIESLDFDTEHAPFTGDYLFRLEAQLSVPGELEFSDLRDRLRELEDEYNFDVLLEP